MPCTGSRWPRAHTILFKELWAKRADPDNWSYEELKRAWPTATHGEVDGKRFYNKVTSEANARERQASKEHDKRGGHTKSKSGRKLTPTKRAAEAKENGSEKRSKR